MRASPAAFHWLLSIGGSINFKRYNQLSQLFGLSILLRTLAMTCAWLSEVRDPSSAWETESGAHHRGWLQREQTRALKLVLFVLFSPWM